jgi:hypothetical protein
MRAICVRMRFMKRGATVSVLALGVALLSGIPAARAASGEYVPTQAPSLDGTGSGVRLLAVDCSSVGNCVAVGTDHGGSAILVETDGVWKAVPDSSRVGIGSTVLVSVSCPAPGACVAVGNVGTQGVIETQSGNTWTGTKVTGPDGLYTSYQGSMASVACPAAGTCEAVGQADMSPNGYHGVIATLKSGSWTAQKAPELYSGVPESAGLAGVACSAPGECRAVGYARDDSPSHARYALVVDEKDYVWAHGAAQRPGDAATDGSANLVSISCIGSTFVCMAAGSYDSTSGTRPMIQTIDANDTATATVGLLPVIDSSATLNATSCADDGTCQSVGFAYDNTPTDVEYGYGWDGYIVSHTYGAPAQTSAGVIASNTRSPADANTTSHNENLAATSCVSGGVCVAVGSYVDQQGFEAGVINTRQYDSDGNIVSETDVPAPTPADDPTTDDQVRINGVSCSDAAHCVAVGTYLNDTGSPRGVIDTLGDSAAPAPTLGHLSPNHASTAGGATVTITGTNMTGVASATFGGKAGSKLHILGATQLTVVVPAHVAGVVDVRLKTAGGASSPVVSADRFTYVAPPTVTDVSPARGTHKGGTTVTIIGSHLSGATKVTFGGALGTHVKVTSATKMVVTSPAHPTGNVDVRVTTKGGTSRTTSNDRFRFT